MSDLKTLLFEQLAWHWSAQLRPRLEGLTDDEYFYEPAPDCWTVRRVDGRWRPDGGLEPDPPPLTTIAWRLCHIATVLGARASFHFGDRSWRADRIDWPGTAQDALTLLDACWDAWASGVDSLTSDRLEQHSDGPPGTLDARFPLSHVIQHVNREVIHHGAEVALLRDLWRATRPEDPLMAALLTADRATVEAAGPDALDRMRAEHPALIVRAAERGNVEAVVLLVELGFDVNAMTSRAALHVAAGAGDLALVRTLLALGADPTLADPAWQATALGWAEYFDRAPVAAHLRALPD